MPPPGSTHVQCHGVARPHHAAKEHQQRRTVGLLPQRRNRNQREPGVNQGEDGVARVLAACVRLGWRMCNRAGAPGTAFPEPWQVDRARKRGGKQCGRCHHHSDRGRMSPLGPCQPEIFPAGQRSHQRPSCRPATLASGARETPEPGPGESVQQPSGHVLILGLRIHRAVRVARCSDEVNLGEPRPSGPEPGASNRGRIGLTGPICHSFFACRNGP